MESLKKKKKVVQGFPGGSVAKKNPSVKTGDLGSSPWSRKIPQAAKPVHNY